MSKWWCLDCKALRELTQHGFCAVCGSQAVVYHELPQQWSLAHAGHKTFVERVLEVLQ